MRMFFTQGYFSGSILYTRKGIFSLIGEYYVYGNYNLQSDVCGKFSPNAFMVTSHSHRIILARGIFRSSSSSIIENINSWCAENIMYVALPRICKSARSVWA